MPTQETDGTRQLLGIGLVLASTVAFSLSGVLTKAIESDTWTIACWRGLLGAVCIVTYVLWRNRTDPSPAGIRLGWRGWLLASVGSLASLAFIAAFKMTYVANVAIIYATVPFAAALLEWVMLRQKVRRPTMIAAMISVVGVLVIVGAGAGSINLLGDFVAVLMMLGNALYMVLIRVFSQTPVVLAGAASAFQLFVIGWFLTDPLAVSLQDGVLLTVFGLSFAIAVILWTEGTRCITAAESGLLGAAEVPLAILMAWMFLAEVPPMASFAGGLLVLCAVLWHAVGDYRRANPVRR
ncbi:DMT family transporter [uncultured Roseovarius sp.]|uniref:DMT family transporter n=1 Tax=uncultured Roseovarius sp. TaxID=293344 RepID=UPI00261C5816|nr:DMT family transporter [uncultured Roseovarius sp.]